MYGGQGRWPWVSACRPPKHAFPSVADPSPPSLDKCMEELDSLRRGEGSADFLKKSEMRADPHQSFSRGVFAHSRLGEEGGDAAVVPNGTDSLCGCLALSPCKTGRSGYCRDDPICKMRGLLRGNQWSELCSDSSGQQSPRVYEDEGFSFRHERFHGMVEEDAEANHHSMTLLDGWLSREASLTRACSPSNVWMQENVVNYVERELKELEDQHAAEGVVECASRAISDEFFHFIKMELRRLDSGIDLECTPPSAVRSSSPFEALRTPEKCLPTRLRSARFTSSLASEEGIEREIDSRSFCPADAGGFGQGDESVREQPSSTSLSIENNLEGNVKSHERTEKVWKPVLCLRHLDQLPTSLCHYSQTPVVKPGSNIPCSPPVRETLASAQASEECSKSLISTQGMVSDKFVPKNKFEVVSRRSNLSVAAQRRLRHLHKEKVKGKKRRRERNKGRLKGLGELQKFQQPKKDGNPKYEQQQDHDSVKPKAQTNSLSVQIPLSRVCLRKNLGSRTQSPKTLGSEPDGRATVTDCLKSSRVASGIHLTPESEGRALGASPPFPQNKELFPITYTSLTCPVTRMLPDQPVQVMEKPHLPHTPLSIAGEQEEPISEPQTGLCKSINLMPYSPEERRNKSHYISCVQPYNLNVHSPCQSFSFPQMPQELRASDMQCQTLCGVPFHAVVPWQHHVTPPHSLPTFQDIPGLCVPFLDLGGRPSPDAIVKGNSHCLIFPDVCPSHTNCPRVQEEKARHCRKTLKWNQRDLAPGCTRPPFLMETELQCRKTDECKSEENEFFSEGTNSLQEESHWLQEVKGQPQGDNTTKGENKRPRPQSDNLSTALHIQVRTGALAEQRGKSRAILSKLDYQNQRRASRVIQVRTQEGSQGQRESGKAGPVVGMPSNEVLKQDKTWGRDTNISILQIPKSMQDQDSGTLDKDNISQVPNSRLYLGASDDGTHPTVMRCNQFLQNGRTKEACLVEETGGDCEEKDKCSLLHTANKNLDMNKPCEKTVDPSKFPEGRRCKLDDQLQFNTKKDNFSIPLSLTSSHGDSNTDEKLSPVTINRLPVGSGWKCQKYHPYILPKKRHKNMFQSVGKVDGENSAGSYQEAAIVSGVNAATLRVEEHLYNHDNIVNKSKDEDVSRINRDSENSNSKEENNFSTPTKKTVMLPCRSQTSKVRSKNCIAVIEEHSEMCQSEGSTQWKLIERESFPSEVEVSTDGRELVNPNGAEVKRFILKERQTSDGQRTPVASQSKHYSELLCKGTIQSEPTADTHYTQGLDKLQRFESTKKERDTNSEPLPPPTVSPSSIVRQGAHFGLIRKIAPCLLRPNPCKALSRKGSLMNRYLANRKRQMSFLNRRVSPMRIKRTKLNFGTSVTSYVNGKEGLIGLAPQPKDSQPLNSLQDGRERVTIYSPSGRAEDALIDCGYFAQNLCDLSRPKEQCADDFPFSSPEYFLTDNTELDAGLSAATCSIGQEDRPSHARQSPEYKNLSRCTIDNSPASDNDLENCDTARVTKFRSVLGDGAQETGSNSNQVSGDLLGSDQAITTSTLPYCNESDYDTIQLMFPAMPTPIPAHSSETKLEEETNKAEQVQETRVCTLEDGCSLKQMNCSPNSTMGTDSLVKIPRTDWSTGEETIMCIPDGQCIDEWQGLEESSVTSGNKSITSPAGEHQGDEGSFSEGLRTPRTGGICSTMEEPELSELYQEKEMPEQADICSTVLTLDQLESCELFAHTPPPPSPQRLDSSSDCPNQRDQRQNVIDNPSSVTGALAEGVRGEPLFVGALPDHEVVKDGQHELDLLELLTAENNMDSFWPKTVVAVEEAYLHIEGDSYPAHPINPAPLNHKEGNRTPPLPSAEGKLPQEAVDTSTDSWDAHSGDGEGPKTQPCLLACGSSWAFKRQDALSSSSSCSSGSSVAGEYEEETEVLLEAARKDDVSGGGGSGVEEDRGEAKEGCGRRKKRRGKNSSCFIDVLVRLHVLWDFRLYFLPLL